MTQTFTETLVVRHCPQCHVAYGISEALDQRCKRDGTHWYCPNGHRLIKITTERDDELKKRDSEIERLKESLQWEQFYATEQRTAKEHAQRKLAAKKGQITKLKNRAANGVCPCCNRYFENLHRHMNTQHPDFRTTEDEGNPSVESSDKTP